MALLVVYVLLAVSLVAILKPHYFFSILLVFLPPSLINFYWLKNRTTQKRIFWFSLASLLFFAPPIELATRMANVWDVASLFPRPFGLIPLENMLFAFFNFFWGLSFYAYFDPHFLIKKTVRFKYLIGLYLLLDVTVYGFYFLNPALIKTSYLSMAILTLVLPAGLIFYRCRDLMKKTLVTTLFFASVFFLYEMVSLKIGSWWWPGSYLYSFHLQGRVFPLDDIIIWYFLSTPALIAGFEYFANDYDYGKTELT